MNEIAGVQRTSSSTCPLHINVNKKKEVNEMDNNYFDFIETLSNAERGDMSTFPSNEFKILIVIVALFFFIAFLLSLGDKKRK